MNVRNVFPIVKKEMRTYFNSPIAYIVVVFFLVFTSMWLFYFQAFFSQNTASLRGYFGIMPLLFVFLIPAITMRAWAEERKMGTDEILLTLPFRESELVAGKYLASLGLVAAMLILTLPLPLSLQAFGDFDAGQIFGEYLGILLLASAGIAVGLFVSSVATNQISAFLFGAVVLLFVTMVSYLNVVIAFPKWLAEFLNYLALDHHFESFKKGVLDTRDLTYFVVVTALFLVANQRVILFRKWR